MLTRGRVLGHRRWPLVAKDRTFAVISGVAACSVYGGVGTNSHHKKDPVHQSYPHQMAKDPFFPNHRPVWDRSGASGVLDPGWTGTCRGGGFLTGRRYPGGDTHPRQTSCVPLLTIAGSSTTEDFIPNLLWHDSVHNPNCSKWGPGASRRAPSRLGHNLLLFWTLLYEFL